MPKLDGKGPFGTGPVGRRRGNCKSALSLDEEEAALKNRLAEIEKLKAESDNK